MAKISFSPLVGQVRGKAGSVVFTKGRSGATVRTRVKPKNPRTTGQAAQRNLLTTTARQFKNLSTSNAAAWNAAAALVVFHNGVTGAAYHPSGMTYYNKLSIRYLESTPAGTPPTTPPSSAFAGDTITITAAGGSGAITFTGSAQQGAGIKTYFLTQRLASANRQPSPKGYRVTKIAAIPATPFQVTDSLPAGIYAVGYFFVLTATGQATQPVFLGNVTVS